MQRWLVVQMPGGDLTSIPDLTVIKAMNILLVDEDSSLVNTGEISQ